MQGDWRCRRKLVVVRALCPAGCGQPAAPCAARAATQLGLARTGRPHAWCRAEAWHGSSRVLHAWLRVPRRCTCRSAHGAESGP